MDPLRISAFVVFETEDKLSKQPEEEIVSWLPLLRIRRIYLQREMPTQRGTNIMEKRIICFVFWRWLLAGADFEGVVLARCTAGIT
jgi:hypothetical protein